MSAFYSVRREYSLSHLDESALTEHPIELFESWFIQWQEAKLAQDPTAMQIATVDEQQMPHQRTVLMKSFDQSGFVFYTNQQSRKARHLDNNPNISAFFPWVDMERQVIVSGTVSKLSDEQNDAYFMSRPEASRLAAWASEQSQPIASRQDLEQQYQQMCQRYQGEIVPRPPHWGGYLIEPSQIEFWQGGEHRLHDRFVYRLVAGQWQVQRWQP